MESVPHFDRITVEPGKCQGLPCIRGMRITVRRVLELLAGFPKREDIFRSIRTWKRKIWRKPFDLRARLSRVTKALSAALPEAGTTRPGARRFGLR
jgi:hypothetical protein